MLTNEAVPRAVQVHLRLNRSDADLLRRLAEERGHTLSGFVRHLIRVEGIRKSHSRRSVTQAPQPASGTP
jgi:hypothetical protein